MKVLLVEDEDRGVRQAMSRLEQIEALAVTVAKNRDEALAALDGGDFDLIVCDIQIPSRAESADIQEAYGLEVHAHSRRVCPGTPSIFLTGFPISPRTRDKLSEGGTRTLHGEPNFPIVQLCEKSDLDDFGVRVARLASLFKSLESRVMVANPDSVDSYLVRAVQSYAVGVSLTNALITKASGHSGASTARVELSSEQGHEASIFAKVMRHDWATAEFERYNKYVANRLQSGDFAASLPPIEAGLGRNSALLSNLASSQCKSLFRLLASDAALAAIAISDLSTSLSRWQTGSASALSNLRAIRQAVISDEEARSIGLFDELLDNEGSVEVAVTTAIRHGDLHGENVLIDASNRPFLIDFGDVSMGLAALDAVTAELSILLHPSGPARESEWSRSGSIDQFSNVESFVSESEFAEYVVACRRWGMSLVSESEYFATAYGYCMRQAKFDGANKQLALRLATAAQGALLSA